MPIAKLFVEGKLESESLTPILEGSPVLQRGGSKNALKARALTEREENSVDAGYLRDRDFDYDPPEDLSRPTVDYERDGITIGWRWCRHEIENYLIEPMLISSAMQWPVANIEDAIRQAAKNIRHYEAGRWTIGTVRRQLPPHYELNTRPDNLKNKDIGVPAVLDVSTIHDWISNSIGNHRDRIASAMNADSVRDTFDGYIARFDDDFLVDIPNILLWFSGKDILAGMENGLKKQGIDNAGKFREKLRNWVRENPQQALEWLPEWSSLTAILRS